MTWQHFSKHVPLPVQPCKAKRISHASGQASGQGLGDQPNHGTLSGQSPDVQPPGPIGIGPLRTPLAASSYTEHPTSASGGCILKETARNCQLVWVGTGPGSHPASSQSQGPGQSPSARLDTTHWWSCRWPVGHPLLGPGCTGHNCTPQFGLWALVGGLWHGIHCYSSNFVVGSQSVGHTAGPGHPQQGICINVCLIHSIVQLKIVDGKAGHPAMTHCIQLCHH